MAASFSGAKLDASDVTAQALDALESGHGEVLADERTRMIKAALTHDLDAIYPDVERQWALNVPLTDPVAHQQLGEPVRAAHQIHPDRLPRGPDHPKFSSSGPGTRAGYGLAASNRPHQLLGVTTVGLNAIPRLAWDLARRRDLALHTTLDRLAREAVPRRSGFIRYAHRRGSPAQ